jgi:Neuraminidase (sialidase)
MTVFKNDNRNRQQGASVAVLRSTDQGASWSGQINVSRLGTVEVTDPDTGDPVRTGDIIPEIASDERADHDEVYVVWQDARFNGFQRDQVAFARSTDGGRTWSTPVRISTHNETQAFTPAIRVDDEGNIGVTYYDFRKNDPDTKELETDVWFTRSTDGGRTWSEERVTPESFDMRQAPVARGYFVGDYEGLSALGTTFYPFWSQSDSSGTDVYASTAQAPFPAAAYTPSTTEGSQPASAFPVVKGKPIPR